MSPFVLCLLFCCCIVSVSLELFHPRCHPPNERLVVWWIVLELAAEGCWLLALRHSTHQHSARSRIGRSISGCGMFTVCLSTVVDPSSVLRFTVCPSSLACPQDIWRERRLLLSTLQLRWIRLDITRDHDGEPYCYRPATAPLQPTV